MSVTVMVVDDQKAARMGLTLMINRAGDLRVVAQAVNGQDAVDQLEARARACRTWSSWTYACRSSTGSTPPRSSPAATPWSGRWC